MLRYLKLVVSCIVLMTGLFAVGVDAQRTGVKTTKKTVALNPFEPEANPYDLDQCRNGAVEDATNPDCIDTGTGASGWVNGNAGNSNSHWAESQFIAYRARLLGLTNGTHTIILQYDIRHSNKIAIDYLGSYNVTETDANPCSGVVLANTGCGAAPSTFDIPADPAVTSSINPNTGFPIVVAPQSQRKMTMWGGTITNVEYVENPFAINPATNQQARTIRVTFTSTVPEPVLAWGGHIGWRGDWGAGNSAGGISGSPYHMRIISLDGSGGNEDRSLSADAVDASGGIVIIKQVETADNQDSADADFSFTSTGFFPPSNQFLLRDDNNGPGVDSITSSAIFDNGGTTTVFVTETPYGGFTLLNVDCDDGDSTQNSTNPTAEIRVTGGEIVRCTFVNGLNNPSAASAGVSGRVTTSWGSAISGATVMVQNLSTGETQYLVTNSYGRYAAKGLPVGDFYAITVMHRRYVFTDPTVYFTLESSLTDMDFTSR